MEQKKRVRFVTAASLFDGHDASINIMRRILQSLGVEVIHLGHNRSVEEIVSAAIQEDVQGIAVSSYQGGHVEYFKYMYDLLKEKGASHIRIYGGGGGVIIPSEREELHHYGIAKIFSPEDGRLMGLQGMIQYMVDECQKIVLPEIPSVDQLEKINHQAIAQYITVVENALLNGAMQEQAATLEAIKRDLKQASNIPVLGITGTGGAGKSSLTDELIRRFLEEDESLHIAVLSIDPTKQKTGGALLGDRIRMNSVSSNRVYMRSLATRSSKHELSAAIKDAVDIVTAAGFDMVIVETSGIGQADAEIKNLANVSMYVMTSEFGAPSQLEKIEMLDYADFVVINKFEKKGSEDAKRQVQKQYQRNHERFEDSLGDMPVYGTIASQFNDPGTNHLYNELIRTINQQFNIQLKPTLSTDEKQSHTIIPPDKQQYLQEIVNTVRDYHNYAKQQGDFAHKTQQVKDVINKVKHKDSQHELKGLLQNYENQLSKESKEKLERWAELKNDYRQPILRTYVRGKEIKTDLQIETLSGLKIPKVALPTFRDDGDILHWLYRENVPGEFPFTAGVFPFKRKGEDPKRQFAGEGTPERTNRRFHYLSKDDDAKRLSTAFDSVTLYGENPAERPDIFGKIGESGVSVCTLDDMKKLYEGFDLCAPSTSVSMTINGPAPIILAMFMNVAIAQQVNKRETELKRQLSLEEYETVKSKALSTVRGTVQADILKEDQGQNTCIFSTEFALKMMGDIQEYFTKHHVRNYYSVSISGYHIAEAGANPISQLAFTLANGFTYVEYYLSRGMNINDFAPNLSFFFSNGLDPEYTVIGRVARRIWAIVMRDKYGANERSQKLKYHVQTSGRSLHAQEIQFNDIRTTLQALMALHDNCNSLHTNAYDEAITTPTEESVRRAMAIQLIITKENGLTKNENPLQGSFIVEELTDLVEEAVLQEFERINTRGGVLGAMELQYQRGKIQDESMEYEMRKHNGSLPIVGVNTYRNPNEQGDTSVNDMQLARASWEEKNYQIEQLKAFQEKHADNVKPALERLKKAANNGENIFAELMNTVQFASLGEITQALYKCGGQYRRNM
ncbi:methylmalonyl-CoA mutase family protein [Priestia flexa]|jgi:isobutyryl-CoA mutase|uniref:Fused isobutyryl-CoA mutase n=1 Tax=Priestia flexa TaxID=86664 RepID=A0A8I1MJD0_9BACI|nr:fused isobutyryl-CoA mutase/GTPase IcmF [Priestia flexa]MBN8253372.1 methylmalonyl-CoA mutase family protein [Priestia flexa]MCA1203860.1 methylmalonyl-CoA mutase family protein [Priestia flexa]RIV07526.1 methylmalonyl-CoA mutase [Priestia flexa]UIR29911.1 methylmalonyl-CoA mutase family protein [Priestia flexa]